MTALLKRSSLTLFSLLTLGVAQAETSIQSIDDLKALQSKVSQVAKKVLPATVSLFSEKNGASGSGVIVSEDGLILTAGHVIRGAEEMTVIFPNGKQARAKVLGANYTRDSAMAQLIGGGKWPHVEVGQSKDLKVGDLVVALGHAGGYDPIRTPPVRFGRLIAHGRNQFITTDCTLIGGDSGGPLYDLEGRVVGIHSSIGGSLSTNNHASIEGFHQDWEKLKKGETWGRLGGGGMQNPDSPVIGIIAGNPVKEGLSIRQVVEGGPAGQAGIRSGDIIVKINGNDIGSLRHLHREIFKHKPGDSIKVQVLRDGETLTRSVKLGRRGDVNFGRR